MDEPEVDLIEEARAAGRAYIDLFGGDLKAVIADLRRRSEESGRVLVERSPLPPHPWQVAALQRRQGVPERIPSP